MSQSIKGTQIGFFAVAVSLVLVSLLGCQEKQTACSSAANLTSMTSFALRYGVKITDEKARGVAVLLKNGQLPSGLTKWDFAHNCLGDVSPFVTANTLLLRATAAE